MIYEVNNNYSNDAFFLCPVCNTKLYEGISRCGCRVNEDYYLNGNYYTVVSVLPWDTAIYFYDSDGWNDEWGTRIYAVGGPNIVLTSSFKDKEVKVRIPKNWKSAKSNDDMRFSWSRTHGGLKGSLLRAKARLKR